MVPASVRHKQVRDTGELGFHRRSRVQRRSPIAAFAATWSRRPGLSVFMAMFASRRAFTLALCVLCHSTRAATVVDLGQPPNGLEWRTVTASALHKLLRSSYVASDDGSLALDYPEPTLQWMLGAPGARDELQLGLGEPGCQSLVACVCAAPCELLVRGEQHQALEVGLLCVHHSWRSRGLTPLVTEAAAYPLVPAAPQLR
jgi:hypothetical protein